MIRDAVEGMNFVTFEAEEGIIVELKDDFN